MKSILSLFNDLGDLLYQISLKTKLTEKLREAFEDGLKSLIEETLQVISQIEKRYYEIEGFSVDEVNDEIRSLIDDISIFFAREKKAKDTFNEVESKLYDSLTWNLHILTEISAEFKKNHPEMKGLLSLDKASAKKGDALLREAWNNVLRDVETY